MLNTVEHIWTLASMAPKSPSAAHTANPPTLVILLQIPKIFIVSLSERIHAASLNKTSLEEKNEGGARVHSMTQQNECNSFVLESAKVNKHLHDLCCPCNT